MTTKERKKYRSIVSDRKSDILKAIIPYHTHGDLHPEDIVYMERIVIELIAQAYKEGFLIGRATFINSNPECMGT